MNTRGVPAGICVIDLPDGSAQIRFQYEHVMVPDRNSPSGWRCSWKLVPVGGEIKRPYWPPEYTYRSAAAAERDARTARWMTND